MKKINFNSGVDFACFDLQNKAFFKEERQRFELYATWQNAVNEEGVPEGVTYSYLLLKKWSRRLENSDRERYGELVLSFLNNCPQDLLEMEVWEHDPYFGNVSRIIPKCRHYSIVSLVFEKALEDLNGFWWNSAAKTLRDRKVTIDSGYICGHPIFQAYALDPKGIEKCAELVDILHRPDREGFTGGDALSVALQKRLPREITSRLRTVNINKRVPIGLGQAFMTPLDIAVFTNNVSAVKDLLEQGADPNAMTPASHLECFQKLSRLSPFQSAVEIGNPEILGLFRNYKGYLSPVLHQMEQERREEAGHPRGFSSLEITLNAWIKMGEMREDDYEGLKVFCNEGDGEALGCSLKRLFENFPSAFSGLWEPVLDRFKMRLQEELPFRLIVCSPKEGKAGGFNFDTESEIYLESGLAAYDYTHVIAHEMAHVYIKVLQKERGEQFLRVFREKMEQDKLLEKELPEELRILVEGMKKQYPESLYNDELFARACVQFPILYAINHAPLTQEALFAKLEEVMPHTFAHYKKVVMKKD